MSETSKDFSKKLLQRAPSGKLTVSSRDQALTNIQAFYDDPENVTLPDHQEAIRERWETIHGLLLKGITEKRIALKVATLFNVSVSPVRRDMECVETVFGSRKLNFASIVLSGKTAAAVKSGACFPTNTLIFFSC